MSYIPDYRAEESKLNETDYAAYQGYKWAKQDALNFFNSLDSSDYDDETIKALLKAKEYFEEWMTMSEIEMVLALFEKGEYENVELVDGNIQLYKGTKGAKEHA